MKKYPLTFAVLYNGLLRHGACNQKKVIATLFREDEDERQVSDSAASQYCSGDMKLGNTLLAYSRSMDDEELKRRIKNLLLPEPQRIIVAFHSFVSKKIDLDEENRASLNEALYDALIKNEHEIYVAELLHIVTNNDVKYKLSDKKKLELQKVRSTFKMTEDQISLTWGDELEKRRAILEKDSNSPTLQNGSHSLDWLGGYNNSLSLLESLGLTMPSEQGLNLLVLMKPLLIALNELLIEEWELPKSKRKRNNIGNVLNLTGKILSSSEEDLVDEPEKDATMDADWLEQFLDYSSAVSDEDMEFLWAKVLAGETKKPGSFSLRTIKILRDMEKEDALLFQHACRYLLTDIYGTTFLFSDENLLLCGTNRNNGLSPETIQKLVSCNLFGSLETKTEYDQGFFNQGFHDGCDNFLLVVNTKDNMAPLVYHRYVLLPDAKQLLGIVEAKPDPDYIEHVANVLWFDLYEKVSKDYEVHLYHVINPNYELLSPSDLSEYKVMRHY